MARFEKQLPIGSSIYRFADAVVIVLRVEGSDEAAWVDVDGVPYALAFTDLAAAQRRAQPGQRPAQLVMSDLSRALPPNAGIWVDPNSRAPLTVAPEQRADVVAAAAPFPQGARVHVGAPPPEAAPLARALASAMDGAGPGVSAVWVVAHQVEDARPGLLVIADAASADDLADAVRLSRLGHVLPWGSAGAAPGLRKASRSTACPSIRR